VLFVHPVLVQLLRVLFNSILNHNYVPIGFCCGIIKAGNSVESGNNRGITLRSTDSRLFELYILNLLAEYLWSSGLQFGF